MVSGETDTLETVEVPIESDTLGALSFFDMKAMPVVHLDYVYSSVYMDPEHEAFRKNLFIALRKVNKFQNGTELHEFEEFIPCEQVKSNEGYLEIDYSQMFQGELNI